MAAAEGKGEEAAAVAGVTGHRPDVAAQAWTQSSASTLSAPSSQHEAVGEFKSGVLWLASADHAEFLGEPLAEYDADDPLGYGNVDYMVLKVLVELLLLQTGVTGGPSTDTAPQVKSLKLVA